MIKNRFLAAAMAVLAGVSIASCDLLEEALGEPEVSISAKNDSFDASTGEAVVTLSLSTVSVKDVSVILGISNEAENGYTAISDTDALSFESSVSIPAGSTTFDVKVTVDLAKVQNGQEAVISIASATDATVSKTKSLAYIKVIKVDLSGAEVWGIIGAFNGWADDIVLTKTADEPETWVVENAQFGGEFKFRGNKTWGDYDLGGGVAVEPGKEIALVHKGGNLSIEEGVWNVTLYPTQCKAVITAGASNQSVVTGTLDWTVEYGGCDWVPGYWEYGQLETIIVTDTDTEKFYIPIFLDLADGFDINEAIAADSAAFFAELQASVDEDLSWEMDYYEETFEEAIPWVLYNEENDGSVFLEEGLPAGQYQFAVFSITVDYENETATVDGGYKVVSFTKTEDALAIYPWHDNYTLASDWVAEFDGWIEGYEGEYYWVVGNAPGAAYVFVDSYTDDELEEYYGGSIADMYNYTQSSLKDILYSDDEEEEPLTMQDLADYGLIFEAGEDGAFDAYVNTYDMFGATNLYIIGFDAEGNIIDKYGKSTVEVPEVDPIEWVEHTDWVFNYDATVDTGDEEYPDAVVVSVCDAKYFDISIFEEGIVDYYGVEFLADYLGDWSQSQYTMEQLVELGAVGTCDNLPYVSSWTGLENGLDILVFGYDENGKFTGAWSLATLEGYPEVEVELFLQESWSVTPVGESYLDEDGYDVINIEVNAPDILWYSIEENSDDDLDYYYDGTIANFALAIQDKLEAYLESYTMDELLWSNAVPAERTWVYNFDIPTTIYIVEFDENGQFTGRYGATDVVIPSGDEEVAEAPALRKVKFNVLNTKKNITKKAAKPAIKAFAGKQVVNKNMTKAVSRKATVRPNHGTFLHKETPAGKMKISRRAHMHKKAILGK